MAEEKPQKTIKINNEDLSDEQREALIKGAKDFMQIILNAASKGAIDLKDMDLTDAVYKLVEVIGTDIEISATVDGHTVIKGKTSGKTVSMDRDGNVTLDGEKLNDDQPEDEQEDQDKNDKNKKGNKKKESDGEGFDYEDFLKNLTKKQKGKTDNTDEITKSFADWFGFDRLGGAQNPFDMFSRMSGMGFGNPFGGMGGGMFFDPFSSMGFTNPFCGMGGYMPPMPGMMGGGYMPGMMGGCIMMPPSFMGGFGCPQVPFGHGSYFNFNMQQMMMMFQMLMACQMMSKMTGIDFMSEFLAIPEVKKLFSEMMKTMGVPGSFMGNFKKLHGVSNGKTGGKAQEGFDKAYADFMKSQFGIEPGADFDIEEFWKRLSGGQQTMSAESEVVVGGKDTRPRRQLNHPDQELEA